MKAYLDVVRSAYPDLAITTAELNLRGQNNDVLVVNGEIIFRFPRYPGAIEHLRTESAILQAVGEGVPLPVPSPTFVHLEGAQPGEAFVGYRKLPGAPLWRETFHNLGEEVRERLAAQLGTFLEALHAVPPAAVDAPLTLQDTHEAWADIYARIREPLFPHMRPAARDEVVQHFETYLDNRERFDRPPVLKHGDFGPSNILFDAAHGEVSGIIDFGGAGLGDPAYDFAGLLSGYGEPFLERCGAHYAGFDRLRARIHFYRGTFALLEALFGAEHGDRDAFEAGMARYR